jgi:hypothetical protein
MNAKTLYGLVAAALVALAAAWWISSSQRPETDSAETPKLLLPGFRDQVNDVDSITLTGAGDKVLTTLERGKDGWTIADKSGYPADLAKLREFLLKLADATVLEQKTSNPKLYAELGVSDVKDKDAKGVLVTLGGIKTPVKLIVGNYNGGGGGGTFVRRDGAAQSLLVKGNISVDKTAAAWERKEIADIAEARIKQATLTDPDGKVLKVYKDQAGDANFKVADVPKGRELSSAFVANGIGSMLSGLRADDVFAAKDKAPDDKPRKADYLAFDGLKVDAVVWTTDGKDYAQFTASLDDATAAAHVETEQAKAKADYDAAVQAANKKLADEKTTSAKQAEANAKAASETQVNKPLAVSDPAKDKTEKLKALNDEVAALNKTFSGWTFVLPSYKFSNVDKSMDDLLKPLETKKAEVKGAKKVPGKPAAKARPAAGKS